LTVRRLIAANFYTVLLSCSTLARADAKPVPLGRSAAGESAANQTVVRKEKTASSTDRSEEPRRAPIYSTPWALRSVNPSTSVRADTILALQDAGTSLAGIISASYRFFPQGSIGLRESWVSQLHPAGEYLVFGNPGIYLNLAPRLAPPFRLNLFFSASAPLGQGGGNDRVLAVYNAISGGVYARSAMDGAPFAVNFATLALGVDFAYVEGELTIQASGTVFQGFRARGDLVEPDVRRTNSSGGLHIGYALWPFFIVSAEVRYQRWLTTPRSVELDGTRRDQLTAGGGFRFDIPFGEQGHFKPGIAFFVPADAPMTTAGYRTLQLDLPFVF
jgi:hypothetical protein